MEKTIKTASKNAVSQALRLLAPQIKRTDFFKMLGVRECKGTAMRYWNEYKITPWVSRTADEKTIAKLAAIDRLINAGQLGLVNREVLVEIAKTHPELTAHVL